MSTQIVLNGQWQGGADPVTLNGARELQSLYFSDADLWCASVDESPDALVVSQQVVGYDVIVRQTKAALDALRRLAPSHLLTIGGGCDADVASIQYLQARYEGDLAVLWMDAHGDINAPWESTSHLFYGMPLRALLGGCGDAFADVVPAPLSPGQVVQLGGRDLDPAERAYLNENNITTLPVIYPDALAAAACAAVRSTGKNHLYVHLDLDVLDPVEFPHVPVPVPGGLQTYALIPLLSALCREMPLVGLGLYEYKPCGRPLPFMRHLIDFARETL